MLTTNTSSSSTVRSRGNSINDLDLGKWKEYEDIITDSLWLLGRRDNKGPHRGDYHGNFVPQIPHQVLRRYTKRGEVVVDLFSGLGTSLIESRYLGRHGIGVELQAQINAEAQSRLDHTPNPYNVSTILLTADSRSQDTLKVIQSHLHRLGYQGAHHVILHPPYWDIIKFSSIPTPDDLSWAPSLDDFYRQFSLVAHNAYELLLPGRFMTLVIGDKYSNSQWYPLGFGCMERCLREGFTLKAINVKDIQGNEKGKGKTNNLWRYRALKGGFYIFKHEYVMIFHKPKTKAKNSKPPYDPNRP